MKYEKREAHNMRNNNMPTTDYLIILTPIIALTDTLISLYVHISNKKLHDEQTKFIDAVNRSMRFDVTSNSKTDVNDKSKTDVNDNDLDEEYYKWADVKIEDIKDKNTEEHNKRSENKDKERHVT